MVDTASLADKPFPSYLEIPARLPKWFWYLFRAATFAVMGLVIWLVAFHPEIGFALFWKLLIPCLPLLFAITPGIWRQICPMALLNQIPRSPVSRRNGLCR